LEPDVTISGARPLFVAALYGHVEIVRYLLSKGADVSAKTSTGDSPEFDGLTPLEGAVKDATNRTIESGDTTTIIRLLLLAGADPRISRQSIIKWIEPDYRSRLSYSFNLFKLLASVPKLLNEDIREWLSQSLALNQDNGTLLSAAFLAQDLDTLRVLLHLGVNPDANGQWNGLWYLLGMLAQSKSGI